MDRELVVARYNEDTSWLRDWPFPVTIYNKGFPFEFGHPLVEVIDLPNLGREAGTWLDHICHNYRHLADWTYFLQGHPHSPLDRLIRLIDGDLADTTPLAPYYLPHWPGAEVTDNDQVKWIGNVEVRWGNAFWHGARTPENNREWLAQVWSQWFSSPQPEAIWYGYGAEYAVPRHRITDRPLKFWTWLHDVCLKSDHTPKAEQTATSGWGLECVWAYLWGDASVYRTHEIPKFIDSTRIWLEVERCPNASGSCGWPGNPPRDCSRPDQPNRVMRSDCYGCKEKQFVGQETS